MANPIDLATLFREQIGGRRNLIINGAMQVAQRGTSITCPVSAITYTMDRFFARPNSSTETTVSQVTDAPDGFQYSARVTRDSGQTGPLTRFETPLETRDIIKLRGQKVTVSFYAKAGSNLSTSSDAISLLLFEGNGTEGARATGSTPYDNETTLINSPKTLTTSWQRFTHTTTNAVASDTTQLAIQFQAAWSGTALANDEFYITGIQLEVGETATPFEHRSYAEELALCYRYYQTYPSSSAVTPMFTGTGLDTTRVRALATPFGGLMRAVPAITLPTTTLLRGNGSSIAVTSVDAGFQIGGGYSFVFNAASGLLGNHVYYVVGATAADALELSAEL